MGPYGITSKTLLTQKWKIDHKFMFCPHLVKTWARMNGDMKMIICDPHYEFPNARNVPIETFPDRVELIPDLFLFLLLPFSNSGAVLLSRIFMIFGISLCIATL